MVKHELNVGALHSSRPKRETKQSSQIHLRRMAAAAFTIQVTVQPHQVKMIDWRRTARV